MNKPLRKKTKIIFLTFMLLTITISSLLSVRANSKSLITSDLSKDRTNFRKGNSIRNALGSIVVQEEQISLSDGIYSWATLQEKLSLNEYQLLSAKTKIRVKDQTLEFIVSGSSSAFKDELESICTRTNAIRTEDIVPLSAQLVKVPLSSAWLFNSLCQVSNAIESFELNGLIEVTGIPSDPDFGNQWGWSYINIDEAWEKEIGNYSEVIVAIIDSGIDYNHNDLKDQYVPLGFDWVNNDSDPMDNYGHGTSCASIVAASINNSFGMAGIANVSLMAEKMISGSGSGTYFDGAKAIVHAVDVGADILSCSWGTWDDSDMVHSAFKYAVDNEVLCIASAGNYNSPLDYFPGAYPEVINVASIDSSGLLSSFSNYGDHIELAAPGSSIYLAKPGNSFSYGSGTSYACPHVAGVAALILSAFPQWTTEDVRDRLREAVMDKGPGGWDEDFGYGVTDASEAVLPLETHDLLAKLVTPPRFIPFGESLFLNATLKNWGTSTETDVFLRLLIDDVEVAAYNISSIGSRDSETMYHNWTAPSTGTYNIKVVVDAVSGENNIGNNQLEREIVIADQNRVIGILHDPYIDPEPLGPLYKYYREQDYVIEYVNITRDPDSLQRYQFIFLGANYEGYEDYGLPDTELDLLDSYMNNGGIILSGGVTGTPARPPAAAIQLGIRHGITFSNQTTGDSGLSYEINETHPLFKGVNGFNVGCRNKLLLAGDAQALYYDKLGNNIFGAEVSLGKGRLILTTDDIFDASLGANQRTILRNVLNLNSPQITLLTPNGGETLSGNVTISWKASDLNGDELQYSLEFYNGSVWTTFATGLTNQSFIWNTTSITEIEECLISVTATDGTYTTSDTSDSSFTIDNTDISGSPTNNSALPIGLIFGLSFAVLIFFFKRKKVR